MYWLPRSEREDCHTLVDRAPSDGHVDGLTHDLGLATPRSISLLAWSPSYRLTGKSPLSEKHHALHLPGRCRRWPRLGVLGRDTAVVSGLGGVGAGLMASPIARGSGSPAPGGSQGAACRSVPDQWGPQGSAASPGRGSSRRYRPMVSWTGRGSSRSP